ncbi:MAG TPA: DNA polymerase IV [Solirubrobacteraceae bacterium]|nr:DNA polymerase IV [Solirubrobacteraceae bacterium]
MPVEPTILHADLDAFYASVEQRDNPALRGRPVIVGGGVVLAASYEAKACGVRTAMGGARARALCPRAVVVSPRFAAYTEASKDVFAVFERTSPLVEALSIDEAFLDVRGMRHISGTPTEIAVRLRQQVRDEVGLAITVGLACTKFLAKVASGVAKPDGLLVIPGGGELAFLHPLPVERLWGVGQVTAGKLHAHGLTSVGQVARLAEETLVSMLGRAAGRQLYALSHNRDPRRVTARRRRRSIGAQRALGRRRRPPAELDASLMTLVDRVARRMRAAGRACRTVVLRLRFDDYSRATRSHTLTEATTRTATLLRVARGLLAASGVVIAQRGLTLIGIALTNLCDAKAIQLALPFDRTAGLDRAIDELRDRFGSKVISRGTLVGQEVDVWVPLLPD